MKTEIIQWNILHIFSFNQHRQPNKISNQSSWNILTFIIPDFLLSRLQDISDQITTNGCISPNVFAPFTNLAVRQAIVSSRHLAFLLQDGRICRVSFRIQTDKIDPNTIESNAVKTRYLPRSHSRPSLQRANFDNPGLPPQINAPSQLDFFSSYSLSRQRPHMVRPGRGRAGIFLGSRPTVPASSVPEDLIEQVSNKVTAEKDSNRND